MRYAPNIIENITPGNLKEMSDDDLYNLRSRFINIYDRHFAGSDLQKAVNIERSLLLVKYITLRSEMSARKLKLFRETALDIEIYNRIFKKSMWQLDVPALGDVVIVPEYISIGGSFIKSPREADDVDIIIREDDKDRDESMELKVGRIIQEHTKKESHFVYAPRGPHSSYIPLFDLILRAREETKKVNVKETLRKKFTPMQYTKRDAGIEQELNLEDFEYLLHHIEIKDQKELVHHCLLVDHMANTYEQSHLWIDKGKVYLDGKEIKEGHYHVIKGLEPTQEIIWSEEEAADAKIKPKQIKSGMTLKDKAKEW